MTLPTVRIDKEHFKNICDVSSLFKGIFHIIIKRHIFFLYLNLPHLLISIKDYLYPRIFPQRIVILIS